MKFYHNTKSDKTFIFLGTVINEKEYRVDMMHMDEGGFHMYYSAGTYESFARPLKPKDVDKKSAYIIGTGLAGLTTAFYLVRDGQMSGEHIHLRPSQLPPASVAFSNK